MIHFPGGNLITILTTRQSHIILSFIAGEVKSEESSDEDSEIPKKTVFQALKTEQHEKPVQKDTSTLEESSLNGIVEAKTETKPCSEKPPSDVSVITKAPKIKEESLETQPSKTNTSVSPSTNNTCLSTKMEKRPEIKKSSEEIQQALKNDQLAKIPLKKRGMKFSEDFEKTSSVIVTNPLPAPLREIPKILPTPEPANKVLNDHVNGDVKPTSEKHLQRISDPLADKERSVDLVDSKEKMVEDGGERKDGKSQKDSVSAAEKITEATQAVDVRSQNVQVNKENVASGEKPESLPEFGVIKTASANHHMQDKAPESKPADVRESCIVANLPRETDKSLATAESEVEKPLVEKKQREEDKVLEVEKVAPEQVEAEETAETPRLNEEKAEGKMTIVEKQHRENDQSEPSIDSEKTQSSPDTKKETVEEKDHSKKQDAAPTLEKDEAKISNMSEETFEKSEKTPAESSETQEEDEIKEDSSASQKKTPEETQSAEEKNPVISKAVKNQDDGKQSDSKGEAMEVEEAGRKLHQTEPQMEDKAETDRKDETPRNLSKEEDQKIETAHKEEKMECEGRAKPTEVEQSPSEVKPSNGEGANKPEDQEDLTKDGQKRPNVDKEYVETVGPITSKERATETKTDKKDRSKTSTALETVDGPLKEKTDEEKAAVEEKKENEEDKKHENEKKEASKEVANGVKAPMDAAVQRGKRPVHRRRTEVQREERAGDSESDTNTGMSLRRSPRISRPTAKAVEISDKKQERTQTDEKHGEDKERKEGEEEEEAAVVEKVVQRKPREKKVDQDGQTKPKVSFLFLISLFAAPAYFPFASLPDRSALNLLRRGGRGGRSDGPTLGRVAKSGAPRRRRRAAATRHRVRTTARRRRRTTATKTTRWSAAGRDATATGRGGALTRTLPPMTTCPPTTTPASTAVYRTTRSWCVPCAAGQEENRQLSH